jgi:Tol biopolymer transport system component
VLSADAGRLAYVWTSNNAPTVVVQDLMGGARRVASLTTNGLPAVASDTLPVLSPDGGKVLFEAIDSRLVTDDWNRATDVFLHDLSTRETQLVSRRHADRPALTAAASMRAFPGFLNAAGTHAAYPIYDDDSPTPSTNRSGFVRVHDLASGQLTQLGVLDRRLYDPMLSADGRYVGYSASLRRLIEPSRDGEVYWQDLLTGTNLLIAGGIFSPYGAISPADRTLALSGDGQKLAFQSVAAVSNLVPGLIVEGNNGSDIFVRDMRTGSNQLVSIRREQTGTAFGDSTSPVFSPDGRWVVFRNTGGGITSYAGPALYARDLVEQKSVLLAGNASMASFSADSRFVSYSIGYWRSELFDLYAGTNALVCTNCDSLSVSADGRWVAFRWWSPGRPDEIYVRDMHSGALEWISVSRTGGTNLGKFPSRNPRLSYDGRYVVFASTANDLVPNDTNAASDIFVRDRFRGLTFLASLNSHGTQSANGASFNPVLAADGRTILFTSDASDLVEGDYNEASDVFVLRLGGPDTDQDGLDDDWELAYFNTLNRDGSGDFDGDGQNDKAEFAAGTDPTNSGSIFRVRTITPLAGLGTTVEWEAVPGRAYRVQWKASVDDPVWAEAAEVLVASGTTATWTDPHVDSPHRFYRAILVR